MTRSVTLLTERQHIVRQWREALTKHDIELKVIAPGDLANAVDGQVAVIVDVDGAQLDADDLLSTIGFVRASGALPIAHVDRDRDALEDIITELCHGLVTSGDRDVTHVAAAISRRADQRRHLRFEFVTVSPCGDDVLAVLGNGEASLHRRPLDAEIPGEPIVLRAPIGNHTATVDRAEGRRFAVNHRVGGRKMKRTVRLLLHQLAGHGSDGIRIAALPRVGARCHDAECHDDHGEPRPHDDDPHNREQQPELTLLGGVVAG